MILEKNIFHFFFCDETEFFLHFSSFKYFLEMSSVKCLVENSFLYQLFPNGQHTHTQNFRMFQIKLYLQCKFFFVFWKKKNVLKSCEIFEVLGPALLILFSLLKEDEEAENVSSDLPGTTLKENVDQTNQLNLPNKVISHISKVFEKILCSVFLLFLK